MTSNTESSREKEESSYEEIKELVENILRSAHNNRKFKKKSQFNEIKLEVVQGIYEKKAYSEIAADRNIRPQQVKELAREIWRDFTNEFNKNQIYGKVNKSNFTAKIWKYKEKLDSAHEAIVLLSGRLVDNKVERDNLNIEFEEINAHLEKDYKLKIKLLPYQIERSEIRIALSGSLEDLENLKELFRADELTDILNIPINDIQILNKSLDGENNKHELAQSIRSQVDKHLQLASANLSETDLHNANLSHANLSHANLNYANLNYADLFRATLISASLNQANLRQTDLRQANLCRADLSHAQIDCTTKLSGNEHQFSEIINLIKFLLKLFIKRKAEGIDPPSGTNGSGANFSYANLSGATIINVNLSGADFSNTNLSGATIINVNFNGAGLQVSSATGAKFRANKGLSKNTRRYLKQQGAIFEVAPARRIVGQVATMMWNIALVVVGVSLYFCLLVFQFIKKILPYIAIVLVICAVMIAVSIVFNSGIVSNNVVRVLLAAGLTALTTGGTAAAHHLAQRRRE